MIDLINLRVSTLQNVRGSLYTDISIEQLFDKIKNGNGASSLIKSCRNTLLVDGKEKYDKEKKELPMYCLSSIFDGVGKRLSNVVKPTGLIYIDVDYKNNPSIYNDISNLCKSNEYILSFYRSVSNLGLSIIIYSDSITIDNYKEVRLDFIDKYLYQYKEYIDAQVNNINRFIFITEDRDIYINFNHSIFTPEKKCKDTNITNVVNTNTIILNKDITMVALFSTEVDLSFYNLEYNSDCVYIGNGLPYFKVYFPFRKDGSLLKVSNGSRHKIINLMVNNLLLLNKDKSIGELFTYSKYFADRICIEPFPENRLMAIIKQKHKLLNENKLNPIGASLKYYWVNPKSENRRKSYLKKLSSASNEKLDYFFNNTIHTLTDKVTYDYISTIIGLSLRTIKSHLTIEQKQLIKEHNLKLKNMTEVIV